MLTERRDHLDRLADILRNTGWAEIIVLTGGMGRRKQAAAIDRLGASSGNHRRVVLATGRFIGEGFDDPRLDTLFLAMPISWRGTQRAARPGFQPRRDRSILVEIFNSKVIRRWEP